MAERDEQDERDERDDRDDDDPGEESRGLLQAIEEQGPKYGIVDASAPKHYGVPVQQVRRRRGRLTDGDKSRFRELSLIERDGVLLWAFSDDLGLGGWRSGARRGRRGRRRGVRNDLAGRVLKEVTVPVLEPNEYMKSLADTDEHLNPDCHTGLRAVKRVGKKFELGKPEAADAKYAGTTLLLVHGTFSSSQNTIDEYAQTPQGRAFLEEALGRYKQVLAFDHPTLSVSPFVNAVDLARAMARTSGELDVIAHSRGGVVVRWWLEALGHDLAETRVRAVLVASPLHGTSLAAPNRIHPLISVLTNVGRFLSNTLTGVAAANPFTLAGMALLKFVVRREANRWGVPPVDDLGDRPDLDAAIAVIPGLQGQSAVQNNYELKRLWDWDVPKRLKYYAVTANFDPERMGWKLWKVISEANARIPDAIADKIFPGDNDLVVDTEHMTLLGKSRIADFHHFGKDEKVHHCSYFREAATIAKFRTWLEFDS